MKEEELVMWMRCANIIIIKNRTKILKAKGFHALGGSEWGTDQDSEGVGTRSWVKENVKCQF